MTRSSIHRNGRSTEPIMIIFRILQQQLLLQNDVIPTARIRIPRVTHELDLSLLDAVLGVARGSLHHPATDSRLFEGNALPGACLCDPPRRGDVRRRAAARNGGDDLRAVEHATLLVIVPAAHRISDARRLVVAMRVRARRAAHSRGVVPHACVERQRGGENADALAEIEDGAAELARAGLGVEDAVGILLAEGRRGVRARRAVGGARLSGAQPDAVLL